MIYKLKFPRDSVIPKQTEPHTCFAATSIGILEYYAKRQSPKKEARFVKAHWKLRGEDREGFGRVLTLLKFFDCYVNKMTKDKLDKPKEFFEIIQGQINLKRPIVVQLEFKHCGIIWGYDSTSLFVYVTDPGNGPDISNTGTPLITLLEKPSKSKPGIPEPPSGYRYAVRKGESLGYKVTGYMLTKPPREGDKGSKRLLKVFGEGTPVDEKGYWEKRKKPTTHAETDAADAAEEAAAAETAAILADCLAEIGE